MSGLSFSYKPSFIAWLESRCLSGTLARKIAVVVCTVLALATAVLVELDWHHDRAAEKSELVNRVRADASRLAARIQPSEASVVPVGRKATASRTIPAGVPVALIEVWDESGEVARADVRRVNYHVLGF